jgi:hypothetical protein
VLALVGGVVSSRPLNQVAPSLTLEVPFQHRSAADLAAGLTDTVGFKHAHGVTSRHRERLLGGGCKRCGLHRADEKGRLGNENKRGLYTLCENDL